MNENLKDKYRFMDKDKVILHYIENKPKCNRESLIQDLVKTNIMSYGTFYKYLNELKERGKILYDKRTKTYITITQQQDYSIANSSNNYLYVAIMSNIESIISQNSGSKPFRFSSKSNNYFDSMIFSLIYNYFIMNPDNWYCFKKPEDLVFSLKIDIDLSDYFYIIESLNKVKEIFRKENKISHQFEDFPRKQMHIIDFENKTDEELYAIAEYEQKRRLEKKIEHSKKHPTYLKDLKKQYKNFTETTILQK